MKDYTIILTKILGKDRYEQLVDYSFKQVQKKFGNIRADMVTKIVKINHQALMIIAILKARQCSDNKIIEMLHWNKKKAYKYIVANSFEEFETIYKEYINLIENFIQIS